MSKNDRRAFGKINDVPIVESRLDDHMFSYFLDGTRPGEERIVCTCGWMSASAPPELLDLDVHFAGVNGISYYEQKMRTEKTMRQLGIPWPDPRRMN